MKAFTTHAEIATETQTYGSSGEATRSAVKSIWCYSGDASMTAQSVQTASGRRVQHQIEMWRREYSGQNTVQIGAEKYRVESTTYTGNDLTIRLMLSRG